jgi:hypothetical protein
MRESHFVVASQARRRSFSIGDRDPSLKEDRRSSGYRDRPVAHGLARVSAMGQSKSGPSDPTGTGGIWLAYQVS